MTQIDFNQTKDNFDYILEILYRILRGK